MASSGTAENDIAIIGLSGLFPGSPNVTHFWQNILDKRDQIREAPDSWAMPWYDPENVDQGIDSARIRTRKVGLLGDLAVFHPLEFGIPPKAVEGDPAHYLALQLAGEALRDAGYWDRDFNRERTGVIVGHGSNPNRGDVLGMQYGFVIDQTMALLGQLMPDIDEKCRHSLRDALKRSLPPIEIEQAPTLISNVISGRISNRLDLMGPSYLVDSACSSSLIALDLGMQDLRSGRCDMMLIGGVQASMPAQIYMLFQQIGALAKGDIRPFDATANGTLLSEGVGFVVIKRLIDARRDGDQIYATVKSVGVASDGKAMGLLAPRVDGEALAIRRAYAQSGIEPESIQLLEAHGTGIPLGDRTEILALTKIFGSRRGRLPHCGIGSVKSMIGHCIPAAGIASLIKTSLALHHKILPPTLCDEVNPELGMENTPFYVNNETRPWVHGAPLPRRAAINAFGFGGINTHAILEEEQSTPAFPPPGLGRWLLRGEERTAAAQSAGKMTSDAMQRWPSELIVFSAQSRDAMLEQIAALIEQTDTPNLPELAALARTQWEERGDGPIRLALIARNHLDLRAKLMQLAAKLPGLKRSRLTSRKGIFYTEHPAQPGRVAFLFSSEGSQHPNMLADLACYLPQIRRWFDFLDGTFQRDPSPNAILFPAPTTLDAATRSWINEQLHGGDLASESVAIASHALYELLRDLGIPCDVMVGHSAGEHVALKASGKANTHSIQRFQEELRELNQLYQKLDTGRLLSRGRLISVGALSGEQITSLLREFDGALYLVADNCPSQSLLFMKLEYQPKIIGRIRTLGGIFAEMPFDRAYHTPYFAEGARALRHFYENTIEISQNDIPIYSCCTAKPYPETVDESLDTAARQWVQPVQFKKTIETLYREGTRTFIEVGPNQSLTAFVDSILKGREYLAAPSNAQGRPALEQLQHLLGQLYVAQVPIELTEFYRERGAPQSMPAPTSELRIPIVGQLPHIRLDDDMAIQCRQAHSKTSQDHEKKRETEQKQRDPDSEQASEIMMQHFALMQKFLDSQARTMEQLAGPLSTGVVRKTDATKP